MKSSAAIQSLIIHVDTMHKSETWGYITPNDQRANEAIMQARADLLRCVGNLERAEKDAKVAPSHLVEQGEQMKYTPSTVDDRINRREIVEKTAAKTGKNLKEADRQNTVRIRKNKTKTTT